MAREDGGGAATCWMCGWGWKDLQDGRFSRLEVFA